MNGIFYGAVFARGAALFMCDYSDKTTTACFSGHRSQKLPWGFNEDDERCKALKALLRTEIVKAVSSGYKTFLCGMAIGFDLICAETVLALKKTYPEIKLIGALPCKNQDCKWKRRDKIRYRKILKQSDGIRCIYEEYCGTECMLERNRFMISHSSLLIALYNGQSGGTQFTIENAKREGLGLVIINPENLLCTENSVDNKAEI